MATKALLPTLKNFAKQELLVLPDDIKLYSNSVPTQASHKVYQSFSESSNFVSSFMSSKFSQEKSVGFKIPIQGLSLGFGKESSSSSGSSNSNAHGASSSKNEMSVVIYEYIPKGSFDLPPSEIILTKAAERRALRINSLKDAFDFFDEFGAFSPVCTYTMGGIFMCEVRASGQSSSNMHEFSSSASSAVSSKISGSIGFGGFELSGGKGSSSASESGGSQKNSKASGSVNVDVKCLNYGPQHTNIDDFRKAINQNRNEWTNIGCHLTKLKPLFEVMRDTDRKDLENAVYFLNIAHIVKELENNMVLQIEKKFEKKNAQLNFDIDLFLSCLSEDIQDIAIEEFSKMSKNNCDDIFKKFEKWMKQIYKNTLNDNLTIIQKILDIGFDFPPSDIHLNNIYFESKAEFCFILYYNDKLRRTKQFKWDDALECIAELKKKNQNYGHYILCNLELHTEVDNVDDLCVRMFYKGEEKLLMFLNEDFLEFHKVNVGDSEISFKDKILTYYIEDEIFDSFKGLKKIEFKNGSLSILNENCLSGLENVQHINFQGNKIRSIEDRSFACLSSLEHLNLSENRIESINDATFDGLNALDFLNLERNAIRMLGESNFANLNSLKILDISDNRITTIECNTFKGLENLEYLDLRSNLINSIEPGSFDDLKSLQKLLLNYNKLSSINSGIFDGLDCLKKLDLSKNLINKIDDNAFSPLLEKLECINIGNNKIEEKILEKFSFKKLKDKSYDSKRDE